MNRQPIEANPFSITKADDYNDRQILQFWVDTPNAVNTGSDVLNPKSPIPIYLLGAKGSGKTHLMRFHSFPLQRIRIEQSSGQLGPAVENDGYIGIYVRCGGLDSGRFAGKGQSSETWEVLFAYYLELWLTSYILDVVEQFKKTLGPEVVKSIVKEVADLFDTKLTLKGHTVGNLVEAVQHERRHLDREVNNCVLKGNLDVEVKASPGRLVFGVPIILAKHCAFLKDVTFIYLIDELENLSEYQQRLINSLVRDRQLPTTFRVGARLYGIKTQSTFADQEENLPDSEYVRLVLDEEMRKAAGKYNAFARQLLGKRLSEIAFGMTVEQRSLQHAFAVEDESWSSSVYIDVVKGLPSEARPHFKKFREKLGRAKVGHVQEIAKALEQSDFPLVEKAAILAFYRRMRYDSNPLKLSEELAEEVRRFVGGDSNGDANSRVRSILDHYRGDIAAQLRRENHARQHYLGLNSFVMMSGGLPRALLTIIRTIFDWAIYNGENPMEQGGISIDSQYRGVREASEWFFSSMRKSGRDGAAIQSATERLGQLFRVSRFSDMPVECSLISFSVSQVGMSSEARRVLEQCVQRSFIHEVSGGQKDRNTMEIQLKYQLHPMLCPRWELPIGRRGTMKLPKEFADAVFELGREREFSELLSRFRRERSFSPHPNEGELF